MAEWSKAAHLSCALSGGEGSNPSAVIFFVVLWRSWLARRAYNAEVAGSKPAGTILYTTLARELTISFVRSQQLATSLSMNSRRTVR